MTIRDIFVAIGFQIDENEAKAAENRISDIKNFAVQALSAIGIGFSLSAMNQITEEFQTINNQIRNATQGLGDQEEIQQKILKAAQETRSAYSTTAKYVSMMVQENSDIFGSIDDAIAYNNVLQKMWRAAGKSNEEIEMLMEAVNKSFAKGKIDSETISQLLEQSPEAIQYLNKQLGSTTDQLEDMATDGKISLQDLYDAFMNNADDIDRRFGDLSYKISDAILYIRNKWGMWLADLNETTGLTQTISRFMTRMFDLALAGLDRVRNGFEWLADRLGGTENALKLLAIIAGSIYLAFHFEKISKGLSSVMNMIGGINLKTLAIAGILIALFLIIDDFVNFMLGNNSVIGEALEAAGIDADEMREKIVNAWNDLKEAAHELSEAFAPVMERLSELWEMLGLGESVWDILGQKIAGFLDMVIAVLNGLGGIVDFIKGIISFDWDVAFEGLVQSWDPIWQRLYQKYKPWIDFINSVFGDNIDEMAEKVDWFFEKVSTALGQVSDWLKEVVPQVDSTVFGGIANLASKAANGIAGFLGGKNNTTVQQSTVNNSAGNGGNRTNNINQKIEVNNTFNKADFPTMQTANKATTDVVGDLTDTFKFAK